MGIRQSIGSMAKPKPRAFWELRPGMRPGENGAYMFKAPGSPPHFHTDPNEAKAKCDAWNAANAD